MKALKALKEYFTHDIIITLLILIMALSFLIDNDFSAMLLCFVLLELRDIRELLEDKK